MSGPGGLARGAPSGPDHPALLRHMIRARRHSQRFFALQRQGRIGTFAPIDGQEAVVVGAVAALDPATDWVVPQYREQVALARYGDEVLFTEALYLRGHPGGGQYPEHVKVFPPQISLAAQIPHAVGLAWGLRLRGEPGVVACFFGDGASSEGDFYEAANFAGVLRAPVVLVLTNNHWAISTPVAKQTAAASFAGKAAAFGMPGVRVDGNDVLAVRDAVAEARARAVAGDGPTLVEAVTYRMGHHTTADDPTRYVPSEERAAWEGRDPIARSTATLTAEGRWSDADQAAAEAEADELFDRAFEAAEAAPLPPDAFFDHLYAHPPARQVAQRQRFCREWEG